MNAMLERAYYVVGMRRIRRAYGHRIEVLPEVVQIGADFSPASHFATSFLAAFLGIEDFSDAASGHVEVVIQVCRPRSPEPDDPDPQLIHLLQSSCENKPEHLHRRSLP